MEDSTQQLMAEAKREEDGIRIHLFSACLIGRLTVKRIVTCDTIGEAWSETARRSSQLVDSFIRAGDIYRDWPSLNGYGRTTLTRIFLPPTADLIAACIRRTVSADEFSSFEKRCWTAVTISGICYRYWIFIGRDDECGVYERLLNSVEAEFACGR